MTDDLTRALFLAKELVESSPDCICSKCCIARALIAEHERAEQLRNLVCTVRHAVLLDSRTSL